MVGMDIFACTDKNYVMLTGIMMYSVCDFSEGQVEILYRIRTL